MSTDHRSQDTIPPGGPGAPPRTAPPSEAKRALTGVGNAVVVLWWQFFDWLAVVPWTTLLVVAVLALIPGAMLKVPQGTLLVILAAFIVKVVAGGKRRAELTATQATKRAEAEQLDPRAPPGPYNGRAELIIALPPAGGTCATIRVPCEIIPAHPLAA